MSKNKTYLMEGEEKIADGIYLTKAKLNTDNQNSIKKETIKKNYVFKSTSELISLLENDFDEIVKEIKMLFEANDEMLLFDPKDYDLIEARKENLEVINKQLIILKEIQSELGILCPTNPICKIDIFEIFTIKKDYEKNSIQDLVTEIDL